MEKADSDKNPPVTVANEAASSDGASDPVEHLKQLKQHHHWDPNLPDEVSDEINEALQTSDSGTRKEIANELLDNSPYPEVRAAVPNEDEGGHSNTIRAWVIGLILATIGSGLNMLFSMRQPYIIIPSYVAQVVAYPIGVAWHKVMPNKVFKVFGVKFNLNPGPFSKKEHAIAVIMANATFGGGAAYATDTLLAQRAFYHQRFGWAFELFMCIST
ncbi:OPT oligopeptide transporter protein-domain-containing protein [Aspergillus crustosus]